MTRWSEPVADVNDLLLDRQIIAADGTPVGKVDDLEFTDPDDGTPPTLTAILCGPLAFGPRLGGLLGLWWLSTARRLRREGDPAPAHIPFDQVESVDRKEICLSVSGDHVGAQFLRTWTREKIVDRLPGGTT
ncbi:MAG TPA: hypothetical protein VFX41_10135 [Actinomycetales bacterium]|nr:hypothetical protein [Actinomycetales bacterium]